MLMLKNPVFFFNTGLKIQYRQFLIFLSFMKKLKSRTFFKRSKKIQQLFRMHSQKCESHQIYEKVNLLIKLAVRATRHYK